jgi:hypothetical protein
MIIKSTFSTVIFRPQLTFRMLHCCLLTTILRPLIVVASIKSISLSHGMQSIGEFRIWTHNPAHVRPSQRDRAHDRVLVMVRHNVDCMVHDDSTIFGTRIWSLRKEALQSSLHWYPFQRGKRVERLVA